MSTETFQIPIEAAEAYEAAFVPAFFAQWAPRLLDIAGVAPGQSVLDVACGTGIVARTALERLGSGADVVGVDLNEAMLTVARRVRPDLDWRQGDVADLPFPDSSFDTVLCQMALMFFPDRAVALTEMSRVAVPGGTVAVAVPAALDQQEAFRPFVETAVRHLGPAARSLLSSYFVCGDLDELRALVEAAGLRVVAARTVVGRQRYGSVDAALRTELDSTPLGARIGKDVYARLLDETREVLRPYTQPDGGLETPFATHLLAARRPPATA